MSSPSPIFEAAKALGARSTFTEGVGQRHDVLAAFAERAAAGTFEVPVVRTFAFEGRAAMETSMSGHARGKVVVLVR